MAYGEGRSRLYRDMGMEEVHERSRYERQLSAAEDARSKQSENMALARLIAKAGYAAGPTIGAIAESALPLAVDYYDDAEKYLVSTDPGKFDVSKHYEYEEVNRLLRDQDKSQNWQNVTDVGTSLFQAYTMGGGELGDSSNFLFNEFGGKEGGGGFGLFGKGRGGQSTWDLWSGKELSFEEMVKTHRADPGAFKHFSPES